MSLFQYFIYFNNHTMLEYSCKFKIYFSLICFINQIKLLQIIIDYTSYKVIKLFKFHLKITILYYVQIKIKIFLFYCNKNLIYNVYA